MPYYFNPVNTGIISANSLGDGIGINIKFNRAYPRTNTNKIGYNIYYSTSEPQIDLLSFFNSPPQFISIDSSISVDIYDFVPGQLYHFAVRAFEYDPTLINLSQLPVAQTPYNTLRVLPQSLLKSNMTQSSLTVPLVDSSAFPTSGIVKVGVELIKYTSNDTVGNNLNVGNISNRGLYGTQIYIHNTDGYDGYTTWSPYTVFYDGDEEQNTVIYRCLNRIDVNNPSYTTADGYKQVLTDILTTDLSVSDAQNVTFPSYDYVGWHRTDPVQLLNGECVGSYIGGEQFCADGYGGVGSVLRGFSLQQQQNNRLEMLLSMTGEPVNLFKRMTTGIVCDCYLPTSEYPDDRCPRCYGTKFVVGWQQYFNPRRSDGRIMIRIGLYTEDLKMQDSGLESEAIMDCWTLTVPTLKDRDFFVRFNVDGTEEFRYEVLDTTRNRTVNNSMFSMQGAQKFKAQRIRKTDPLYKVNAFYDTSMFPSALKTSITNATGIGIHQHTIVVNEKTTSLAQINQLTSVDSGHSHPVVNGIVQSVLGHTHNIVII